MDMTAVITGLSALAHPSRLAVFRALVQAGEEGLQPSELIQSLDIAANTLSFHLKELKSANLVTRERQGRAQVYRADFVRMQTLIDFLTHDCCGGKPCKVRKT
jgi:DNA-binding transcriptional ArsR family regulator